MDAMIICEQLCSISFYSSLAAAAACCTTSSSDKGCALQCGVGRGHFQQEAFLKTSTVDYLLFSLYALALVSSVVVATNPQHCTTDSKLLVEH